MYRAALRYQGPNGGPAETQLAQTPAAGTTARNTRRLNFGPVVKSVVEEAPDNDRVLLDLGVVDAPLLASPNIT